MNEDTRSIAEQVDAELAVVVGSIIVAVSLDLADNLYAIADAVGVAVEDDGAAFRHLAELHAELDQVDAAQLAARMNRLAASREGRVHLLRSLLRALLALRDSERSIATLAAQRPPSAELGVLMEAVEARLTTTLAEARRGVLDPLRAVLFIEAMEANASVRATAALLMLDRLVSAPDPSDEIREAIHDALTHDLETEGDSERQKTTRWMLSSDGARHRDRFAREVQDVLRRVLAAVVGQIPATARTTDSHRPATNIDPTRLGDPLASVPTEQGHVLAWDDALLGILHQRRLLTSEARDLLLRKRAERLSRCLAEPGTAGTALEWWVTLQGGPGGFLEPLVDGLWNERWKRVRDERGRARHREKNPAGLVTPVYAQLGDALTRATARKTDNRLVDAHGRQLPLLPIESMRALDKLPTTSLGTLTAHRLVRWLVWAATVGWHHGAHGDLSSIIADGITANRTGMGVELTIVGGLDALTKAIYDGSGKRPPGNFSCEVRDVLDTLASVRLAWDMPGDRGNAALVQWREAIPNSPTAARMLLVAVGPVLCPGIAPRLRQKKAPDADRLIVPVLSVPPLPAGGRAHPALARLDWLAVRYLAEQQREALAHGGVVMPWDALGRQAQASAKSTKAAVDLWTTGPQPRWEEVTTGRFMLANSDPETAAAREFILAGGALRDTRAAGGRASTRRRKPRKPKGTEKDS